MSKINVDTWEPEGSGTTITAGASGDTLAISADSVTGFNVGSDARGDILYHDGTDYTRLAKPGTPADELLTFATGASDPAWVAAPAGGLAGAYTMRMESDYYATGTAQSVLGNNVVWAVDDTAGYASIGGSGSVTAGVFTYPSTGIWMMSFYTTCNISTTAPYEKCMLETSINTGGAWTTRSQCMILVHNAEFTSGTASCIFDCENTTTHLFRVSRDANINYLTYFQGDANINYTYVNFIKLGAT